MKTEIRDVLGFNEQSFKVPMKVYESYDEADKAAGVALAALTECNNNLLYRGTYADARELIVDVVQELTKVPFLTVPVIVDGKPAVDSANKPIVERDEDKDSDAKYVKRALAATPTVTFESVQSLITSRANGYTYTDPESKEVVTVAALAADITKKARTPKGPKTLPAKYKDTAKGILAAKNVDKFNKAAAKYGIAAFIATGKPEDETALGWSLKRYAEAKSEEAKNEFAK